MGNEKFLSKLEKYSPWIKINRKLAGPVLIISVAYVLVYLAITFYIWGFRFQMTQIQSTVYYIGFGLFIIVLYFALTGFLLRGVNKERYEE